METSALKLDNIEELFQKVAFYGFEFYNNLRQSTMTHSFINMQ